ncbi:hypothetical protein Clacol_009072 [Clathrus columnatus]|uniref:Uncharacterized protein n=1 Tax=Clathrus columnatus TaxID=1419009 RepID=A0AAV5AJJ3_9AGAM|nr:hypothetical protein Clacol_009072 [Clathrus columnatus]
MVEIPDRENLESMSRTDIQKLCKDNNIKANMRTDEMINALCDLMNGKDVPRPTRSISERTGSQPPNSRVVSVAAPVRSTSSKLDDTIPTKKVALQPSESNTDVESVVSTPASLISVPTTRRKAKDIQTRLGKGRPVAAGGSGARKITKAFSRGTGRKTRTSMVLQAPIPEEAVEELVEKVTPPATEEITVTNIEPAIRLPSPHSPQPRFNPLQAHSHQDIENNAPVGLPTPTSSHPSYSLPQMSTLETRLTELEGSNFAGRLSKMETTLTDLQSPFVEVSALKNLYERLDTANKDVEAQVVELTKMHTELKARTTTLENQVKDLLSENLSLKQKISELQSTKPSAEDIRMPSGMPAQKDGGNKGEVDNNRPTLVQNPPLIGPADLSPSEPALGKRIRCDTPDSSSGTENPQQTVDAEIDAIHRVRRPQKKPRLDPDEDTIPFPFADRTGGPPTSTPRQPPISRQQPSASPPSFFTASCAAPTPLQKKKDDMEFYLHFDEDNTQLPSDQDGNSKLPERPKSAILRTPSPKTIKLPGISAGSLNPIHDSSFFAGTHPVFQGHLQTGELPFPLIPTTPPNPNDILNQSAQYATPRLGDPWRPQTGTSDTQISGMRGVSGFDTSDGDGVAKSPPSPDTRSVRPSTSRRERTDKYNPYFTPQRGPGGSKQRTGLTPIRGFSLGLKSPALLSTVAEDERGENADEDSTEHSPPQLRTLYGTEIDGDSRFGDFGRDLGKTEWGRFLPR